MTYDMLLILLIAVAVLGLIASSRVNSTFRKYSAMRGSTGLRAADVAQRLLYDGGSGASLQRVSGSLTDHFNPRTNTVGLSEAVYDEDSVAALAVAAHEVGHVMQYQDGYGPIRMRNTLLPVANIGSMASPYLVLIGVLLGSYELAIVGVWLFAAIFAFQLITLPVELNASSRALAMLSGGGYLRTDEEQRAARRVLRAAAMTYVVAALSAFLSLMRLFMLARSARRK